MNRRDIFSLSVITAMGLAVLPGSAFAKQNKYEKQLVGMWMNTSNIQKDATGAAVEPFGPHTLGAYMFDAGGHFIQVLVPGEEGAAKGYVATFGTYSVTDGGKSLVLHYIGSGVPKQDGTDVPRDITSLTKDELKIHNTNATPAGGNGGVNTVDTVWKRAN
jgi:hypothetical protein